MGLGSGNVGLGTRTAGIGDNETGAVGLMGWWEGVRGKGSVGLRILGTGTAGLGDKDQDWGYSQDSGRWDGVCGTHGYAGVTVGKNYNKIIQARCLPS